MRLLISCALLLLFTLPVFSQSSPAGKWTVTETEGINESLMDRSTDNNSKLSADHRSALSFFRLFYVYKNIQLFDDNCRHCDLFFHFKDFNEVNTIIFCDSNKTRLSTTTWKFKNNKLTLTGDSYFDTDVVEGTFTLETEQSSTNDFELTKTIGSQLYRIKLLRVEKTPADDLYDTWIKIDEELVMDDNMEAIPPPPPPPPPAYSEITNRSSTSIKGSVDNHTEETIYKITDRQPEFPGGEIALSKYLSEHIVYSDEQKAKGMSGTVFVRFIVEKDGSISNIEVARSVSPAADAEALRVVQTFPAFKPAMQRDKPVRFEYTLPVRFKYSID